MIPTLSVESFSNELYKIAARAGLKIIRRLIAKGDPKSLAQATRLAKSPGAIKQTAAGSQIKSLGRGAEGQVDLVADPKLGITARKLYDPRGFTSKELIQRKADIGKAIDSPNVAKFLGARQSPGGAPMHFSEYVSGTGAPTGVAGIAARRQAKAETIKASRKAGFSHPQDIHKENMKFDPISGKYKTIDFIPAKRTEVGKGIAKGTESSSPIGLTGNLINPKYDAARVGTDTAGGFRRRFLGKQPVRPVAAVAPQKATVVNKIRRPVPAAMTTVGKIKPRPMTMNTMRKPTMPQPRF